MGPVCYRKRLAEQGFAQQEETIQLPPDSEKYIFQRVGGRVATNVPHVLKEHSPTGLAWGYGGSGPADAALNLLVAHGLHPEEAWMLHQDFKATFIARLPEVGGEILKADVDVWLAARRQGAGAA